VNIQIRSRNTLSSRDGIDCGSIVALISIANKKDNHPPLPNWTELKDVLNLEFDDVDHDEHDYVTMSKEQAEEVALFIDKTIIHKDVDLLIVQCEAGISRSSGMAAAILKHITGDDSAVFKDSYYIPNMLVYRLTLEALQCLN
jgi:predicted protein tyrosine phosphatase